MHGDGKTRDNFQEKQGDLTSDGEMYRHFVAESPVGVILLDEAGFVTYRNQAMKAMGGGYSDEEVMGRPFWDFAIHESDAALARQRFSERLLGRSDRYEFRFRHRSGRPVWTEVIARPLIRNGRIAGAFAHVLDISERRRTALIHEARIRLMESARTRTLQELLVATLDEAEALTDSRIGFYHFLEPDQRTIALMAWSTRTTIEMCNARGLEVGTRYDLSLAGVWTDAIHSRRTVIHNDYASLAHKKGMPPGHAPVTRELVTPVFRNDVIVAILGVGNKPFDYDEADVEAIGLLADLAWDVVEQKRSIESLRESEEKFRIVADFTNDWETWTHPDGHPLYISPSCETITGYTAREFHERPGLVADIVHPDDRQLFRSHTEGHVASRDPGPIDYRIVTKSGAVRWISHRCRNVEDSQGHQLGRRVSERDVTRRKQAEEALRHSKALYMTLVEKNPNPVAIVDSDPPRLRFCNTAFLCLFGYDGQKPIPIKGDIFWSHVHPDDRPRLRAAYAERVDGGEVSPTYEVRFVRKDGGIRWVEVSATRIDYKGKPANLIILHDLTERRREEQFRQDVERIIRHDIRSPLFGIYSLAQVAMTRKTQVDVTAFFPQIVRGIRQVVRLLDASEPLRQMERGEYVPGREELDLPGILRTAADSVKLLVEQEKEKVEVTVSTEGYEPSRGTLQGEGFLIEDMLINLLKNAVEASHSGQNVSVALRTEADRVQFEIHNSGAIPEGVRDRFFDKYASAGKPGGTGLGTYSALLIAKAHGGDIEFSTSDATGTTITIAFPRGGAGVRETDRSEDHGQSPEIDSSMG